MHAAGETGRVPNGTTYAVVLGVKNEWELIKLHKKLSLSNIPHKCIYEPDEPYCGALMSIGLYPIKDRTPARHVLGKLQLLKRSTYNGTTKNQCEEVSRRY